jgi:hypothetical protein
MDLGSWLCRRAQELFEDDEELMEFIVKHKLWIIRAILLVKQGKYSEAIKQYLGERHEKEALELALEHLREVTLDADAFSAIERKFLWRYLSFGCRKWPDKAEVTAEKILALLERVTQTNWTTRDREVVSRSNFPLAQVDKSLIWKVACHFQAHLAGSEVDNLQEYVFLLRSSQRQSRQSHQTVGA